MEPISFVAGEERRFSDFIAKLNEKDRIALICHTDLDGVAAAKVANAVLDSNFMKFVDYIDLNAQLIEDLKNRKINKVVFVDIDFDKAEFVRELEKFAEVLIIDHHIFRQDLNSEKTVFLNARDYCTSFIAYYLFNKIQNVSKFDWLVAAASLSDLCYLKNADWLMQVKEKYGDTFSIDEMTKLSRIYDLSVKISLTLIYFRDKLQEAYRIIGENIDDAGNLDSFARDVQKEIETSALRFEDEKRTFGNGEVYFWEFAPEFYIKSILIHAMSVKYKNKTIIIVENNGRYFKVSARRHDGKVNLVELLKKLTYGMNATSGGHLKAAGATILPRDIAEFKERVRRLQ